MNGLLQVEGVVVVDGDKITYNFPDSYGTPYMAAPLTYRAAVVRANGDKKLRMEINEPANSRRYNWVWIHSRALSSRPL